jgi:hypothetical protein
VRPARGASRRARPCRRRTGLVVGDADGAEGFDALLALDDDDGFSGAEDGPVVQGPGLRGRALDEPAAGVGLELVERLAAVRSRARTMTRSGLRVSGLV